jgi:argonaute-like protein implicated in RNA metabolism and viral defense
MLMVSQETYQGTVDPVFYKVLIPSNPNMERIAIAINKLARHHWNTNRALKIPAPAFHADRITYLVRRVLRRNPTNPDILDKPFYL